MTEDTKKKYKFPRFNTKEGTFLFPRLAAPDFKYKKDFGEYSVKLRQPEALAQGDIKIITEGTEAAYKAECAKQGKAKLKRSTNVPFKAEEDDQGNPTGNIIFSFKLAGGFKDKKTGETVALKPSLFHRNGQAVTEEIWGGTLGQVCYELRPYYTDGLGFGMTLRIKAARINKLVTRGQGGAEQYGFEVEAGHEEIEVDVSDESEVDAKGASNGSTKAAGDF